MDIKTPKGQASLFHERVMLEEISEKWKVQVVETNKDKPIFVDGILARDGIFKAVYESKCRNLSLKKLNEWGSWLVTYEKIRFGVEASQLFYVPYFSFIRLMEDDQIIYFQVTDENGELLVPFTVKKTETQKTINGGKINRWNAYIPMKYAKKF